MLNLLYCWFCICTKNKIDTEFFLCCWQGILTINRCNFLFWNRLSTFRASGWSCLVNGRFVCLASSCLGFVWRGLQRWYFWTAKARWGLWGKSRSRHVPFTFQRAAVPCGGSAGHLWSSHSHFDFGFRDTFIGGRCCTIVIFVSLNARFEINRFWFEGRGRWWWLPRT